MSKYLKSAAVAALSLGVVASPLSFAVAQQQPAASTGDTGNGNDQRVDQRVLKSQELQKHHKTGAEVKNDPAPTGFSRDDRSSKQNVGNVPVGAGGERMHAADAKSQKPHKPAPTDTK